MNLKDYHIIYFLGIGGIGMSALARWFVLQGKEVSGYDRTPSPVTEALELEGIKVHFDESVAGLPEKILEMPLKVLVVYTPAVPQAHPGYSYLRDHGYTIKKRSEVLGLITRDYYTIAVAGTHGKTTTSSMVAHILIEAGFNVTAFLGGISTNYGSNFIVNEGSGKSIAVVEADEFDRSFLTLNPDIAIVTSADADHLDVYGDEAALRKSFRDFISRIQEGGKLFIHERLAGEFEPYPDQVEIKSYGLNRGQFFAGNITIEHGIFDFDLNGIGSNVLNVKSGVPGFYNIENAVAAILSAVGAGANPETACRAMSTYKGVKRRFEFVIQHPEIVLIDDYAHHPVEIMAFIESVKALYPDKKLVVVFQPHLYSRTRDFAEEFSESLSKADLVVLLEIYPAREEPIPGVDAKMIFDKLACEKVLVGKEALIDLLADADWELIAILGAGDIDRMVKPVADILKKKHHVEEA